METNGFEIVATLTLDDRKIDLSAGYYVIGHPAGELVQDILVDDESIDVKHAALCVSQLGTKLIDLFSLQGTFVDGRRLEHMEVVKLQKSTKIQFGNVTCHFRNAQESDSGYLALSPTGAKDISEIVPASPTLKQEDNQSQVSRSRIRNNSQKSSTSTSVMSPKTVEGTAVADKSLNDDDSFFIPSTQAYNNNSNKRSFDKSVTRPDHEIEDDFFVPETQVMSQNANSSENIAHINTQDYLNSNEESNNSENLLEHYDQPESLTIPYIEANPKENGNDALQDRLDDVVQSELNDEDTDCEEEMSALRWADLTKLETSVTPDLDLKEFIEQEKANDEESTIFQAPKSVSNRNIEEDYIEPTQIFQVPMSVQNKKRTITTVVSNAIIEEDQNIEPTQIFQVPRPVEVSSDSHNINDDELLQATQIFNYRGSPSPVILESDEEENNTEFCLQSTLVIGENPERPTSSKSQTTRKKSIHKNKTKPKDNKLFETSDVEDDNACETNADFEKQLIKTPVCNFNLDVQTPDLGLVRLPDVEKIKKAEELFQQTRIGQQRNKIMLEMSDGDETDPEDIVSNFLNGNGYLKKSPVKTSSDRRDSETKTPIRPRRMSTYQERPKQISNDGSEKKKSIGSRRKSMYNEQTESTEDTKKKRGRKKATEKNIQTDEPKITRGRKKAIEKNQNTLNTDSNLNSSKESHHNGSNGSRSKYHKRNISHEKEIQDKKRRTSQENDNRSRNSKEEKAKNHHQSAKDEKSHTSHNQKSNEPSTSKGVTNRPATARSKSNPNYLKDYYVSNGMHSSKDDRSFEGITPAERKHISDSSGDLRNIKLLPKCKVLLEKMGSGDFSENKNSSKASLRRKRRQSTIDDAVATLKKKSKENVPDKTTRDSSTAESSDGNIRKSSRTPKPRIAFTKIDRRPYEDIIESIGGEITENPLQCTVLVSDGAYRTWKFLAAMAKGVPIVTASWLQAIAKDKKKIIYADEYLVRDLHAEKRFHFKLKKSLELARRSPLFKDYIFYATANTKPTPQELNKIIECGGGRMLTKISNDLRNVDKFFIISDKTDISVWPTLRDKIPKVKIIHTAGIMQAVMQQSIRFLDHQLS